MVHVNRPRGAAKGWPWPWQAIRQHGALIPDRYGALKQNPACLLERDARAGMLAALRALNLDLEPLRDRGRSSVFERR